MVMIAVKAITFILVGLLNGNTASEDTITKAYPEAAL